MNYSLDLFKAELIKALDEGVQRITTELLNGTPQDHAAYRERVGYVRALSDVANWLDEIEAELQTK